MLGRSMKAAVATTFVLGSTLLCSACGRTPLLPPYCHLQVDPTAIDFGAVPPGSLVARKVRVGNDGGATCTLGGIALSDDSSAWFALSAGTPGTVAIPPGNMVELGVSFAPDSATEPFTRTGRLVVTSNARGQAQVTISLTGRVKSTCSLAVAPGAVDFGRVPIGASPTASVTLTNEGIGPCFVTTLAIVPGSDPQFYLAAPLPATAGLTLAPWQSGTAVVGFAAVDRSPPHHREGQLGMASNDEDAPAVEIPLSADIDVGCHLTWSPTQLDFGLAILNTRTSANLTLSNDGTRTCNVSGLAITADSDADFTLADTQLRAFSVAAGGSAAVTVIFTAADSAPPHSKSGTLVFQTGDTENPDGQVPLYGYVSTVCIEASQWVYTVDSGGTFSRFDPSTLKFTDIGTLRCPGQSSDGLNSMAVDQDAIAWVSDHAGNLFKVDTGTAKCEATSFVPNQHGLREFGMGFAFDPSTGEDTLYIAGTSGDTLSAQSTLATIAFPSLEVTPIGLIMAGNPELTGTGDGELWGFTPDRATTTGVSTLLRIDPATGKVLESHQYPSLQSRATGVNWAVKFWGGSFWIFFNDSVYQVSRDDLDVIHTVLSNTGRFIVGAGVSTCAPLQ
jgi:hypothetical protein